MSKCSAIKPNGEHCERIAEASQTYCYSHDPDRSEERRRNAARAGHAKPDKEIRILKDELDSIAREVLDGELEPRRAAVAVQALQAKLATLRHEKEVGEFAEVRAELGYMRDLAGRQGGGRRA